MSGKGFSYVNTYGIIIDHTAPKLSSYNNQYYMLITLLDIKSYTARQAVQARIQSDDPEKLPKILRYGDILRLNNAFLYKFGRTSIFFCT